MKTGSAPKSNSSSSSMPSEDHVPGVLLATAGYDHTIRMWQAATGLNQKTFQHTDSQVNALEITPDRQLIGAAGYQHIRMYDVNSSNPSPVINFENISKNVTALGFHCDSRWMYTGGEDMTAKIWDLRSHNLQCQRIFQVNSGVTCATLHPNQGELIVGDLSGVLHIWDLRNNQNEQLIPEHYASIQSVSIDADGEWMAAVSNKGNAYVWALKGGKEEQATQLIPRVRLSAHNKYALHCSFTPDSKFLVTTSADQSVKLWNTSDFSLHSELRDPAMKWVWDVSYSKDSSYIFTASSDGIARLWSINSGEVRREYSGHQKALTCVAFKDSP